MARTRMKIGMDSLAYSSQRLAWLEGRKMPAQRETIRLQTDPIRPGNKRISPQQAVATFT